MRARRGERVFVASFVLVWLAAACASAGSGSHGGTGDTLEDRTPLAPVVSFDPDTLPPEIRAEWDAWDASRPPTYTLTVGTSQEPATKGTEECGLGFGLTEVTVVEGTTVRAVDLGAACEVDLEAPPDGLPLSVEGIFALVAEHQNATAHSGRGFGFPDYVTFETEEGYFELYVPAFREGILDEGLTIAPVATGGMELEIGTRYRYLAYLHCGIGWVGDFNGVSWRSDDAAPYATGGKPFPPEDWPLVDQSVNTFITMEDANRLVLEVVGTDERFVYRPAREGEDRPICA